MNRLGLMLPSELDSDAKSLYDSFLKYATTKYGDKNQTGFLTKDARFIGPFGVQLHTPAIGQAFLNMAIALLQLPGLNRLNREIATIVIGVRHNAAFELAAHKPLGLQYGITVPEMEKLLEGKKPGSFEGDKTAVYDIAYELAFGSGPVSQPAWDRAVALLGKDGTATLIQYVAFYSYICSILRGFDVKVPEAGVLGG